MGSLAPQIAEDRQTLIELMARLGIATTRVKRAGAWITEKASRVKFGGLTSGEPDLGLFMALETSRSESKESSACGRRLRT